MRLWKISGNPQTYAYIALLPSGNLQGPQEIFDIYTRIILKRRTIKELPMPNRFARRMNNTGKKSKSEEYGKNPKSLNKTKYKYDWYNYE